MELGTAKDSPASQWQQSVINGGKYLLAAALGLTGGVMVTRRFHRHLEFDADRTGAILAQDPQAMIRGLQQVHKEWESQPVEYQKQLQSQIQNRSAWEKVWHYVFKSYPTELERFERLNRMTKQDLESLPALLQKLESSVAHSVRL